MCSSSNNPPLFSPPLPFLPFHLSLLLSRLCSCVLRSFFFTPFLCGCSLRVVVGVWFLRLRRPGLCVPLPGVGLLGGAGAWVRGWSWVWVWVRSQGGSRLGCDTSPRCTVSLPYLFYHFFLLLPLFLSLTFVPPPLPPSFGAARGAVARSRGHGGQRHDATVRQEHVGVEQAVGHAWDKEGVEGKMAASASSKMAGAKVSPAGGGDDGC